MIDPAWTLAIQRWAEGEPLVSKVYAFGSRARGDHRLDSDFDVALSLAGDDDEQFANWMVEAERWRSELSAVLDIRLDLWAILDGDDRVGPAVKEHGIVLAERL